MFGNIGWFEIIVLGFLGLLIFGKRLPEVGKNLGKGIVEFKKGLSGVEEEVNKAGSPATAPRHLPASQNELQQANQRIEELENKLRAAQSAGKPEDEDKNA